MVCLQELQFCDLDVQIHFFFDIGVARGQRLDLCIGQCRPVNILTGSDRGFGCHDLRDKLLFLFQDLPGIGIKARFRHIAVDPDLCVPVALPEDPAFLLFKVGWLPGTVEMVQGD